MSPIEALELVYLDFENIHPFIDGAGSAEPMTLLIAEYVDERLGAYLEILR